VNEDYDHELRELEQDLYWRGFGLGVVLTILFFAIMWNCGGKS
jgi:hypothetical protein